MNHVGTFVGSKGLQAVVEKTYGKVYMKEKSRNGPAINIDYNCFSISKETFMEECGKYLGGQQYKDYAARTKICPSDVIAILDWYYDPAVGKQLAKIMIRSGEVRIVDEDRWQQFPKNGEMCKAQSRRLYFEFLEREYGE